MHVNKPEPEHNQKAISGEIYTKKEYIYEVNFIWVKRNYRRNATKYHDSRTVQIGKSKTLRNAKKSLYAYSTLPPPT